MERRWEAGHYIRAARWVIPSHRRRSCTASSRRGGRCCPLPAEYAEEATFYQQQLLAACEGSPRTLLELGSGGGNNASHLKARFEHDARRPLARHARGQPRAEPRVRARRRRHAHGPPRARVRLRLRPRRGLLHDDTRPICGRRSRRRTCTAGRAGRRCSRPIMCARTFAPPPITAGTTAARAALRYLEWTWDPDPADSHLHRRLRLPAARTRRRRCTSSGTATSRGSSRVPTGCGSCGSRLPAEDGAVRPLGARAGVVLIFSCVKGRRRG